MKICVASLSANRIEPHIQPIAEKHATLEIGSANSITLFSHVFFSQSALATVLLKVKVGFCLTTCARSVLVYGCAEETSSTPWVFFTTFKKLNFWRKRRERGEIGE
jgi:hypothetical protein